MKTGVHPEVYDVVFVDTSTGAQFIAKSTAKSDETIKINGKEYFVIKIEVSSASHPFYTGKQKLIDTAGRVDKFMAKMKKAQEHAEKNVKKVDDDDDDEEVVAEEIIEAPTEKVAKKAKKTVKKEEKDEETAGEKPKEDQK